MSAIFGFAFLAVAAFIAAFMHARVDIREQHKRDLRDSLVNRSGK